MNTLALVVLAAAAQQPGIVVGTCLPPPLTAELGPALAPAAVAFERVGPAELAAVVARRADVDLLFGVPGHVLAELAAAGVLREHRSDRLPRMTPWFRDHADRFVVAHCWPFVVASAGPLGAGDGLEALAAERFAGRLVLCSPAGAPDFYSSLIRASAWRGGGEHSAWALLLALDARAGRYVDDPLDAVAALADGTAAAIVAPAPLLPAGVHQAAAAETVPLGGLGVALVADSPAARAAYDALLGARAAGILAACGVLPCRMDDLAADALPAAVRDALAVPAPYDVDSGAAAAAARRWREEIRGRGRTLEQLESWLDLGFAALFLAFVYLVYTRLRRSEA